MQSEKARVEEPNAHFRTKSPVVEIVSVGNSFRRRGGIWTVAMKYAPSVRQFQILISPEIHRLDVKTVDWEQCSEKAGDIVNTNRS